MTKTKGGCKTPPYFISTYVKCFISGQIPYSSKSSIILFYRIRTFFIPRYQNAPVPEVMSERPPPSPPIARALPPLNINSALAPAISTCPFVLQAFLPFSETLSIVFRNRFSCDRTIGHLNNMYDYRT